MKFKLNTALLLVALGQVNFFLHNHHLSLSDKINQTNNKHQLKENKDFKKIFSTQIHKQLITKIRDIKFQNSLNNKSFFELENTELNLINKLVKFRNFLEFDFNSLRIVIFGCWGKLL